MSDILFRQLQEAYLALEAGFIDATGIGNRDEEVILHALRKGLQAKFPGKIKNVVHSSHAEDHKQKIDGWIILSDDKRLSVTLKSRLDKKTGKDIIFEFYKDYKTKKPGRDLLSQARYYSVKTIDNRVILLDKKALVEKMTAAVEKFYELLQYKPNANRWSDGTAPNDFTRDRDYSVVVKLVHDPEDGANKIMCYANPDKFPKVLDIKI
jgi:hypothetical protein